MKASSNWTKTAIWVFKISPPIPLDPTQETLFKLDLGNLLLRQPEIGNALSVADVNEELLATLQVPTSAAEKQNTMARRLQQSAGDKGAMAVLVQDDLARISCFVGDCFLKDRQPLPAGTEIVITLGGVVVSEEPITEESDSYQRWQERCNDCLEPAAPPIVEPTTDANGRTNCHTRARADGHRRAGRD